MIGLYELNSVHLFFKGLRLERGPSGHQPIYHCVKNCMLVGGEQYEELSIVISLQVGFLKVTNVYLTLSRVIRSRKLMDVPLRDSELEL